MSRPRYPWNGYIREALRRYPAVTPNESAAIEYAIERTKESPDGAEKIALIEMVFFKRTHTLQGAALCVHCSYETAKRWMQQFMRLVAEKRGLME